MCVSSYSYRYANRACSIKNTPLPLKFTALEEDLLPSVPQAAGLGLVQLQVRVCVCSVGVCCLNDGQLVHVYTWLWVKLWSR